MSSVVSVNWLSEMNSPRSLPAVVATTNTLHVAYRPGVTDRGNLYAFFRSLAGFTLVGFYDTYCFVRFINRHYATAALATQPFGCVTYEPAKLAYEVPYPQPQDENVPPCKTLHVTHLPPNYSKEELHKIFRVFDGFLSIQLHGKYGYAYFANELGAIKARSVLRAQTNLVVSFAKNAARNAFHPESMANRQKVGQYSGAYLPRLQTSAPATDVNTELLAAVLAKCSLSDGQQAKPTQESVYMDQIRGTHSAGVLNSLDLGSNDSVANEINNNGTFSSRHQSDVSSPASYSPPPLSPTPTTPGTAYSEYPWSRRSSADSALSGNSTAYGLPDISAQHFAPSPFEVPKQQMPSLDFQQQLYIAQRMQILQLQYLQQQQMLQLQRQNELLQAARMRKSGLGSEGSWEKHNMGYGAIGQSVHSPNWSPFESKLGFAIPTANV